MKLEFVNPFLSPAATVWEKELGKELTLDKAEVVSYQYTTDDIMAIIGVSGQLEGNVLYGFSEPTAKGIVAKMVGDADWPISPMGLSALGEIVNMITGNAATQLASTGYVCDISPPVILEPRGSTITTTNPKQILVTFESELGPLRIRIGLSENSKTQAA